MSNAPAPWSYNLPPRLKIAIADTITLFSKIDSCIIETRWLVEGADFARKRKIAKEYAADNVKAIREIIESIPDAESDAIWPAMAKMREARNLISHGVWMIDEAYRPIVVWHSKFLEDDKHIGGEYFDYTRFDFLLTVGQQLLRTFVEFERLLKQVEKEKEVRTQKDGD